MSVFPFTVTGSFSGKGKPTIEFEKANELILRSLAKLGKDEKPDKETLDGIEKFVCQLYQPKRWSSFKKRQAALRQAIVRAHNQLMV